MPSNPEKTPASCPVCRGREFSSEMAGFPIKTPVYRCRGCGTLLKPAAKTGLPAFRIEKLSPDYGNAAVLLRGCTWSAEELAGSEGAISVYSDSELLRLAQGAIGTDFLTGDEDCEMPFHTAADETVIFAMKNIYSWEMRPKDEQVAPGLKAFQVKPGEWKDVRLLGEPKAYHLLETLDDGLLYLTDRRLIFKGKRRKTDEDLARIKAVVPFQDGIGVLRKERIKIECYKGDYYWPLVGAVLAGMAMRRKKENAARETS